ncbi:MAG TPA: hypothetical protein VKQ52_20535 [Puia sp.]|nr:hypothetical protein [Puia sp.]
MNPRVQQLLTNMDVLPELGRQRCFELGNPFYYQDAVDAMEPDNESANYWRKELPTGELFLVTLQVSEVEGKTYSIKDTVIRQLR